MSPISCHVAGATLKFFLITRPFALQNDVEMRVIFVSLVA